MQVGNIIFFNYNSSFYHKLIRLYNRIKYKSNGFAHVGIIIDKKIEGEQVFYLVAEALSKGFTLSWYEEWWLGIKRQNGIIANRSVKKRFHINNEVLYRKANEMKGIAYGWFDIIKIGLSLLGAKIGFDRTERLTCSEAVVELLREASRGKVDISKEYRKSQDVVTPTDIYQSKFVI